MSITTRRSVAWIDTDASGHNHFSAVLRWIEETETLLLEQLGIADQVAGLCPRVHVEVDYSRPLRFREIVDIYLQVDKVGRSSLQYSFALSCKGQVAAEGRYVVVHRPSDSANSAPWPDDIRMRLSSGNGRPPGLAIVE